jgi:exopolysaccharide biosynthesis protein
MSTKRPSNVRVGIKLALMAWLSLGLAWQPFLSEQTAQAAIVSVKGLQIQEINATTRLVFDLNGPPKDLSIYDQPGRPMSISFQGSAGACKLPLNHRFGWPNLSGVYVENSHGRVNVFIKRNMTGTVSVNTEAKRLLVTIPHYYYKVNDHQDISEGVRYMRFMQHSTQGPIQVNVLEIDPHHPGLEIRPALASDRMGAKSNVSAMVANHQAVAGINGSFFKQDVGIPLGLMMINQELIAGPIYDRVALGITANNDMVMSRVRLAGELALPDGRKVPLNNINQPRIQPESTVVYSSRWGGIAPAVPNRGLQVQIRNSHVTSVSTTSPLPIPKDGVVISGPTTPDMNRLASLSPNQFVQLNIYTLPDWSGMKHAIGGGPWLVHGGQPYVDMGAQHFTARSLGFREPRSAVGITADGKMLLVTVDGRQKNVSVGMTLYELAYLMQKLGALEAMNLDGGSSTQMSIYGKTVNRPSAGNVGVSNSLIIRKTNGESVAVRSF